MTKAKKVILEVSTHPHELCAGNIHITYSDEVVTVMEVQGKGLVTHGEHGTLFTESTNIIKYTQQEQNPVTGLMQKSFD